MILQEFWCLPIIDFHQLKAYMNYHTSPLHYKELWISAMFQHVSTEDPELIIARSQNLTSDILLDRFLTQQYQKQPNNRHFSQTPFWYHVFLKSQNKHRPHKTPDGTRLSIRVVFAVGEKTIGRSIWLQCLHTEILRSTWSAVDSLQESGSKAKRRIFVSFFLEDERLVHLVV